MTFELQPLTEPGRRLVMLAEDLATDFATRAAQHDAPPPEKAEEGAAPLRIDAAALRTAVRTRREHSARGGKRRTNERKR